MKNLVVNASDGWCMRGDGLNTSHLVTPSRKGVTPRCDVLKAAWLLGLMVKRHTVTPFSSCVYVCACACVPARVTCFLNDLFWTKRFDGVTDRLFMRLSSRHTLRQTLINGV